MEFASLDRRALRRFGPVDLFVILATLWVGELRHGNDPLVSPWIYIDTLVPFLIGWVVAAYAFSAYGQRTRSGYRNAVSAGLVAWFVANVIGQLLRETALFHGGTELSFFLVMLVSVGGAIAVGRALAIAAFGD